MSRVLLGSAGISEIEVELTIQRQFRDFFDDCLYALLQFLRVFQLLHFCGANILALDLLRAREAGRHQVLEASERDLLPARFVLVVDIG